MLLEIILFIVGLALLYWGAELLVSHSTRLARVARIPAFIIGATIIAFGTSAPEFVVSTAASLKGVSDLAFGNLAGSNIANICLILGLVALIWPPKPEAHTIRREVPFLLGISVLVFILSLDGLLSRVDGAILLLLFIFYVWLDIRLVLRGRTARGSRRVEHIKRRAEELSSRFSRHPVALSVLLSVLALGMLIIGSWVLVDSAEYIARSLGVSEIVIGISLVALGTSLPELFTSLIASAQKQDQLSVSTVLGSNIFNILCILGIVSVIRPISISVYNFSVVFPLMVISTALVFPVLSRKIRFPRFTGLILLLGYAGFIVWTYVM